MKGVTTRSVRQGQVSRDDAVAVEEPLEIRLAGDRLAVTMRTPGDDPALAIGFLFSEGIIRSVADVGTVSYCGRPGDAGYGNVIDVTPAGGAHFNLERVERARRGTLTSAACGVCGRHSVEDLIKSVAAVPAGPSFSPELVARAPEILRRHQPNFTATGGVHCAAIVTATGEAMSFSEDIGRHNAVDKAVGALLRKGLLPAARDSGAPACLVVSGRASFEMVQKAVVARLAALISVSAPSSLAVDLAAEGNLTLAAFARDGQFNLYTHPQRVYS